MSSSSNLLILSVLALSLFEEASSQPAALQAPEPRSVITVVLAETSVKSETGTDLRLELVQRDIPREFGAGSRDRLRVISLESWEKQDGPRQRLWQTASIYNEDIFPLTQVQGAVSRHPKSTTKVIIVVVGSTCTSLAISVFEQDVRAELRSMAGAIEDVYSRWVPSEALPVPLVASPRRQTFYSGCVTGLEVLGSEGSLDFILQMSEQPSKPLRYRFDPVAVTLTELRTP